MGSKPLIANELLAFIVYAIDTMDEVSIIQICKSNFTDEDVSSGKGLLFRTLGKTDRMPSRRRDGGEKSLQDIITILKETDPDDVPDFVAKELRKLPPVTFDHVDVTRLLKDITLLKASLADILLKLEVSQNTVSELQSEVALLRNAASVDRAPEISTINTRRGGQLNVSAASFESALLDASLAAADTDTVCTPCPPRPSPASPLVGLPRARAPSPPARAYATVAAKSCPLAASQPAQPASTANAKKEKKKKSCETVRASALVPASKQRKPCDAEGFTEVVRKRMKPCSRNQRGVAPTGPNYLLRPAVPTTLLYVSRLHFSTKVEEIVEYVEAKTKILVRVEQLESRHKDFKSFVVRVPTENLSTFTKEEFWPKNVLFRRFRGRLPMTAHTVCDTST